MPLMKGMVREVIRNMFRSNVTVKFPVEGPVPIPPNYRGLVTVDREKCTLCGTCVKVCPAHVLELIKEGKKRTLMYHYAGCTFCAQCQHSCPEDAITLSDNWLLADVTMDNMHILLNEGERPRRKKKEE